eukprot:185092-Chlamydomonas_euryale.AAC.1
MHLSRARKGKVYIRACFGCEKLLCFESGGLRGPPYAADAQGAREDMGGREAASGEGGKAACFVLGLLPQRTGRGANGARQPTSR